MTASQKTWLISQETLENWLDSLAKACSLIAPRDVDGILLYRPVKDSRQIKWGFTRPVLSAKEVFFPPTERLLKIEKTGQQVTLLETLPEGKTNSVATISSPIGRIWLHGVTASLILIHTGCRAWAAGC